MAVSDSHLLYKVIKIPARWAFRLYCRNIIVSNQDILKSDGPLLIASNHPDSFLDAIVFATLFEKPVYSLTRGDIFKKPWAEKLLRALNMLPVYRLREGAENLNQNYDSFERCREIFKQNGIVLIFSEGGCINEWKLRPLKKGTARLAISSWEDNIDLKIIPVGINYQSFSSFGKNIILNFGKAFGKQDIPSTNGYGQLINNFNEKLKEVLGPLVIEANSPNAFRIKKIFSIKQPILKKCLLLIPAIAGFLIHAPLYLPLRKFSWTKFKHLDHYDSVLLGLLFFSYPLYLAIIVWLLYWLFNAWSLLAIVFFPFFAWSYIQLKKQF